ncbi:MAG: type II toxin-antitoxin system VapC family toxin [Rhodospirillaceae bacterium]|nr:type II toxin-antitoxin system VapC family toxin [Rhodospirillaceae bacterium]
MAIVLDASVAIAWAAETELALPVLHRVRDEAPHAPMLWWYEVHNALMMKERRGLLPAATADTFMDLLAGLGVALDTTPDRAAVVGLARTHRLSVYDAAYLELAQRRAMALASLDRALVTAAKAEGVACLVEA